MALVCQKLVSQLQNTLQNWEFSYFGASQPFCSYEMGAPVLRSGNRVPNLVSQLRKFLQMIQLSCEIGFAKDDRFRRDTLIPQRILLGCETVSQRSANFAEAAKSRRPLFLPCFCSVFAPKDFLSISLHFLLPEIIQKPILHQNKLELKH